ncbi:CPBP family glutamic-type intramembrane protease [Achromobacter aloeverae]|uniref:CPBP family intramembrane metalloprotease n=1 Tax=Achromobacter aloeverae TaxID=1750518 RepID=A0A4Q1HLW6_9BURK|nr:CPBP family intramembrane metalloprotease [Achromobacter aloeverae]
MPRLRDDFKDFLRFVRRPTLRHLPPHAPIVGIGADWVPQTTLRRVLAWVVMLWAFNLLVLGPLALKVATMGGAHHRLESGNIPWMVAIFWAPLVEEMVFRYFLRRPGQALWLVPLMLAPMLKGPTAWSLPLAALVVGASVWTRQRARQAGQGWSWGWRRRYVRFFPLVFHVASLTFAALHLGNFTLNHTLLWLMPVLVLPQWLTGLVLGWMRVRRGIGASVLMHMMFNAGPVLLVLALVRWAPELAS